MQLDATVSVDRLGCDYVIGSRAGGRTRFESSEELSAMIADGLGKEVCLTVYNTVLQNVREVCIVPVRNWGGAGILGCQFSDSARIPKMVEG
jgi:hypothetical protein